MAAEKFLGLFNRDENMPWKHEARVDEKYGLDEKGQRKKPMEILCLGYSRTGTYSVRAALKELGYDDVYHMASCLVEYPSHQEFWLKAFRAKVRGEGEMPTKKEWDELLGTYMAVSDVPIISFWRELLEMYPDAKVILTTRQVDVWHDSLMDTVWRVGAKAHVPSSNPWRRFAQWTMPSTTFSKMFSLCLEESFGFDFPETGKQRFIDHYDAVRKAVPKERLLEVHVKEGWEPFCKFLDKPVPSTSFPNINDRAAFHSFFRGPLLMMDILPAVQLTAVIGALGGVAYAAQKYWPLLSSQ